MITQADASFWLLVIGSIATGMFTTVRATMIVINWLNKRFEAAAAAASPVLSDISKKIDAHFEEDRQRFAALDRTREQTARDIHEQFEAMQDTLGGISTAVREIARNGNGHG